MALRISALTCGRLVRGERSLVHRSLARSTLAVLKAWLREPQRGDEHVLFPNAKGERLSVYGVQYLLNKHRVTASNACSSLKHKRVTGTA